MSSNSLITLWVRSEIFNIGTLPPSQNPRFTLKNIKKIIPYAKSKGSSGYPTISYAVWKHIACNKLLFSEDIAWIYFWVFDLFMDKTSGQRLLEWDALLYKTHDQISLDYAKAQLTVPLYKFVLFLFIQHIHKISLRASLVSGSDEWPTRNKSLDLESKSMSIGSKNADEGTHLTFVLRNLTEILELFIDSEQTSNKTIDVSDLTLDFEVIESLGFLINGSLNKTKNIRPLLELALSQAHKTGFTKELKSFSFKMFQTWIRTHLAKNPYGKLVCLERGRNLCWPLMGECKKTWAENMKGQIITNAIIVPKEHAKGNKLILMSHLSQMTIARSSGTLCNSTVKIYRCNDSFIYLLSPLRSVCIEKCHRSTIVVGAVELSLDLLQCEEVILVGVSRKVTIQGCNSCTIHVITPNNPLIFSFNSNLVFGPYHTYYGKLEEHMHSVGIAPMHNNWNKPVSFGFSQQGHEKVYQIQKPIDFYTFKIPFDMVGKTTEIPVVLTAKYQKSLSQRHSDLDSWQTKVQEVDLSRKQRNMFHDLVHSEFQDWLELTGNKRLLDSLTISSSDIKL